MKYTIILLFFSYALFGQLIPYSCNRHVMPCDTSDRFTQTLQRKSGDTSFILLKHFIAGRLLAQEEQIDINLSTNESRHFFNGRSIQWYANGQKKCEGTFKMGEKAKDWKYWNERGKEISEPKNNSKIQVRGARH